MTDSIIKQQPTILIKKSDGTTERITLEEFKKRKQMKRTESGVSDTKDRSNSARETSTVSSIPHKDVPHVKPLVAHKGEVRRPIPIIPTVATSKPSSPTPRRVIPIIPTTVSASTSETNVSIPSSAVPQVVPEQHLATTTPVARIFQHPQSSVAVPVVSTKKEDLRSLLDEDVSEINSLRERESVYHLPTTQVNFSSSVTFPKDLEARLNALVLSWKKGIRDEHQFREYAMKSPADGGLGLSLDDTQKLFFEISGNATLVSASAPKPVPPRASSAPPLPPKPSIPPVHAPARVIQEVRSGDTVPAVMGPREEILSFSIDDFRRLSRDPKTAGDMVLSKFSGWKDESYLLYLQVRDSWRQSPLYRMYIECTVRALETRQTVATVLREGQLSYTEYQALIEVNRKFEMMD